MVAARQEAQQIIDAESVNTAAHLEASRGPVGHGSDAMIKHYMAKRQSNNAIEIAKLQPVVRTQNNGCDGNEVVLLEPVGAILQGKKDGRKSRLILYNQVPTMGRSPVAQW